MSSTATGHRNSMSWFQIFKYSVYCLLAFNAVLFFIEDWNASAHLFADGLSLSQLIEGYAASIDTTSWVILLLIFELETWVISDEKLKGGLKWGLTAIKLLCYLVIAYAVYGYVSKYVVVHAFEPTVIKDLCSQALNLSFMTDLDEFETLTTANCANIASTEMFYQLPNAAILTDADALRSAQWLALIDVVNASDWLLVVVILSIDVWLQMKGKLTGGILKITTSIKAVLYLILLVCAIFWGFDGDFLDFWDAFLWIVAFAFIELNLFEWHAESEGEHTVLGDSMKVHH